MQNESGKRKFDISFPRQIAVVFFVSAVVAAYPLFAFASTEVIRACIAGVAISLANVLAGYAAIEYSIDKSYTVFLKVVLGGMGVRMLAMLGALLILIKLFHFQAVPLVVSLMGFYILFLILEVMFMQKKMSKKAEG
jgi:branched-subunit amino acid ABC-type transport system permease component